MPKRRETYISLLPNPERRLHKKHDSSKESEKETVGKICTTNQDYLPPTYY